MLQDMAVFVVPNDERCYVLEDLNDAMPEDEALAEAKYDEGDGQRFRRVSYSWLVL